MLPRVAMWAVLGILAPAAAPADPGASTADRLVQEAHAAFSAREPDRARALMEQAAATGDAEALNGLATFVEMGVGGATDSTLAMRLIEQAAERGSVGAKLNLGLRLTSSDDVADQRRAVELLTDVRNNPPSPAVTAQTRSYGSAGLGVAFLLGRGVMQDVARGVDYLEEADESGEADERTLFLLGRAYQRGWDVRQPDPTRALRYFERAAEMGHAESAWQVGFAYLRGAGVPADDALAYDWFVRAGESGDVRGQVSAAYLLSQGRGAVEDDRYARELYEQAAEQGSPHALRGLGEMLLRGEGGPRDPARGLAYLLIAEQAGVHIAGALQGGALPTVSASTRARAERLASEWLREHAAARPSD